MSSTSNRPLEGRKVVVTRSTGQADSLTALLASLGAEPILIPTIMTAPPDDLSPFKKAMEQLSQFSLVVFTSSNAVKYFLSGLSESEREQLSKIEKAAIGPKTAEELSREKFKVDWVPEEGLISEEFFEFLETSVNLRNAKVFIPRAQEGRDVLPDLLTNSGAEVTVVPVYKTIASIEGKKRLDEVRKSGVDWLTFASGSAVRSFFDLGGVSLTKEWISKHQIRLAVIGKVTEGALYEYDLQSNVVAPEASIESMVQGIVDFQKR